MRAWETAAIDTILEQGADVNSVDSKGWSPLHWAIATARDTTSIVKNLLKAGADKNLKDVLGRTALDLARVFNKVEDIAILEAPEDVFDDLPEGRDSKSWESGDAIVCDGCGIVSIDLALESSRRSQLASRYVPIASSKAGIIAEIALTSIFAFDAFGIRILYISKIMNLAPNLHYPCNPLKKALTIGAAAVTVLMRYLYYLTKAAKAKFQLCITP